MSAWSYRDIDALHCMILDALHRMLFFDYGSILSDFMDCTHQPSQVNQTKVSVNFVLFALLLFSCCFRLELAPEDLFLYDRYANTTRDQEEEEEELSLGITSIIILSC